MGKVTSDEIEGVFETIEDCEAGILARKKLMESNIGNIGLMFVCIQQIEALEKYKAQLLAEEKEFGN